MKNRKFMYVFIFLSLSMVAVINYYSPLESLWMLFLVPAIKMVILFPKWKVAIGVGLLGFILMAMTEFLQKPLTHQEAIRLMVTGIVELIVFIAVTFFRIQTVKLMEELGNLALTDPLTKIYNRRYLDLYMERAIPLYKRRDDSMTLILFDIDFFKFINDIYGHNAGDMVLKEMANVIKGIIRETDVFVRTGGEEFIIILPNCTLEQGVKFAERIRKTIEETHFVYKEQRIFVTISVGVAEYHKGQVLDKLIEKADQALYRAKQTGRNKVVVF